MFCLLGRSHDFNRSMVLLKFNCSPTGMRCRQFSAKLSELCGPAKQTHVLETLYINRSKLHMV